MVTRFTDFDISLFRSGKHFRIYDKLGSHVMTTDDGIQGTYFAVWAPNATKVSVMGNFNKWNTTKNQLSARWDHSGIWEGFIPDVQKGDTYKYEITSYDGRKFPKGDPYARRWEMPPSTASVVWDTWYEWTDTEWMDTRKKEVDTVKPYSVYEVHLGSWLKKSPDADGFLTYIEMADSLVAYVQKMNFTHVELLPIMEHPYYPSWGYQVAGYYAPSNRYGSPQDFMYLVECFHKANIGVILDWVPSHFPTDGHGLSYFDGTHLYEHEDPRKGYHPDWKSLIFNYDRGEVRSFLISNALFWLERYHIDGLRVDAVASMLYLDYSRKEGEWIPNEYGGRENLEAIAFLREFNEAVYANYPDAVTIAEESTAFAGVSKPTYDGGLGFGQKWMMGWMHDTLRYMGRETEHRAWHQDEITFSIVYAFSESFMLPLSHDEVVHAKGSLIGRMPGDEWQKFANLRTLFGYMFTHPGTKLLFMGGEFAQYEEWSHDRGLDWHVIEKSPLRQGMQLLVKDLNTLYRSKTALYELGFSYEGFEWADYNDRQNCIISYFRKDKKGNTVLVVCNFSPKVHYSYELGVVTAGTWSEILNTDNTIYGGSNLLNSEPIETAAVEKHNRPQSLTIKIAPLATMVFECTKKVELKKVIKAKKR